MALITRISRLFSADLNAVIDHIEEPEVLLKQSLREMQEGLAVSQARLKAKQAQLQQVCVFKAQAELKQQQCNEELAVCLDAENDTLARTVVRRQLENESNLSDLANKREELDLNIREQQQLVEEQLRDLQSLQQKVEFLEATVSPTSPNTTAGVITEEQIEVVLLKEKQRRHNS